MNLKVIGVIFVIQDQEQNRMELPLNDFEDCQKPQIKDSSPCANISVIHRTPPTNCQSSRQFRARSCKTGRPTEKIIIDLTEDDNNDSTILCTENQSNDQVVHTNDACDKGGGRPNAVSQIVKETPLEVPRVDVAELQRGSDMHEFLLCLGSNVLKDIACNGGWGLVNRDHKVTALITGKSDLPVGRHDKNSVCVGGWGVVNDNRHTKDSFNEDGWGMPNENPLSSNKLTKDPSGDDGWGVPDEDPCNAPSGDDGWGVPDEDPCNAVAQEKAVSNQNSSRIASQLENRDTFWGIPSQDTPHDDGWGRVNEDTHKATAQEKSTSIQTLWSSASDIENTDMSKDRQRNDLDCIRSEIKGENAKFGLVKDTNGYKLKEDKRCSGKYAPSGSNLVPLGKRKIMANQPDREDPAKESPGLWVGKLDDGWSTPIKDLCNVTAQEKLGNESSSFDGWGIPSKDLCNATAQEKRGENPPSEGGWGMPSKDQCNATVQEKLGKKSPSYDGCSEDLCKATIDDGWGTPSEDLCKATVDDGWSMCSDDPCNAIMQGKAALIQTPWSAANKIESREILGQGSGMPNADNVITTRNPLDCVKSEIREQRGKIGSMNYSDEDNMNADRRRSGTYAPSGANLEPLGKRKMTNRPVMKDPCAGGWSSINEETGCTDEWKVSDKTRKITDLTMESPSRISMSEIDLACDDGWGPMNEDHNPLNDSLCDSWARRREKDSQSGSVWGNASEDQCKVTTQENMNLIHTPLSATNGIENRDESLHIPSQGFEMSHVDPINMTQYLSDCVNFERKGQSAHFSTNATFGDKIKRKYPDNDIDGERYSGRYEPWGANLVPLGKREDDLNRLRRYLLDQSMCPPEHSEVYNAVKTLANSIRKILHQNRYNVGNKLSPEDQREVIDNALLYHPDKDNKIGCGVDYIMIDNHPDHQNAHCFFIVRKDGSRSDFSYWKCLKGFVQDKYPDHANEFFENLP